MIGGLRATRRVLRFEFVNTVMRPSFLFAAFGLPLISLLAFYGFALLKGGKSSAPAVDVQEVLNEVGVAAMPETKVEGYIDRSGLLEVIPTSIPLGALRSYDDETAAERALRAGEISAYYLITADYLESGEIIYVEKEFNPLNIFLKGRIMRWALNVNLLEGDAHLANQIQSPLDLSVTVLEQGSQRDESHPLTFVLPYVVMLIFYSLMVMSSSMFLQSLKVEKDNRMLEVLLVSISPRQLISGKIIGLGFAGLLQTMLWISISYALFRLSGRVMEIPPEFQVPPTILVWGVVYYLLGYALYASTLAGIGALVSDLREASQLTTLLLLPLVIPAMMVLFFVRDPNGSLATALSLIPFTAPVAMMTRLAASNAIPLWQPLLSTALMALTAVLVIRLAAHLFQASNLLVGQDLSLNNLMRVIRRGT
jgi:ABC-2 type transport system permease protein